QFGMDVELTMIPFTTDEEGNEIFTFAFQPA
ncbi:DNA-binding protein, partial [Mycobacterium senegalense]|nr:DNA-binding protein [Mycolicibacterium senegalense]